MTRLWGLLSQTGWRLCGHRRKRRERVRRAQGEGGGGVEAARWQRQGKTRAETRAAEVPSFLALLVQKYKY